MTKLSTYVKLYIPDKPFGYGQNVSIKGFVTVTVQTEQELKRALTDTLHKEIIILNDIVLNTLIRCVIKNKRITAFDKVKLINKQLGESSGILYCLPGSENIILQNIIFVGPGGFYPDNYDNLTFNGVRNAWVDNCEFYDGSDGNFDIIRNSNFITVSNCIFKYTVPYDPAKNERDHRFSNLLGKNSEDMPDEGRYYITYYHCQWGAGCRERMIRMRNADVHFIKCIWNSEQAKYFVGPENATALFDECHFLDIPYKYNYIFIKKYGGDNACQFNNCTGNKTWTVNIGTVPAPKYSFE